MVKVQRATEKLFLMTQKALQDPANPFPEYEALLFHRGLEGSDKIVKDEWLLKW